METITGSKRGATDFGGPQPQQINLYYSPCIFVLENIMEDWLEESKNLKTIKKVALKISLLEMAI